LVLQKIPFNFGGVMEKTKIIRGHELKRGDIFIQLGRRYKVTQITNNEILFVGLGRHLSEYHYKYNVMGAFSQERIELLLPETISQTNKK
jgi:hypothetical protein